MAEREQAGPSPASGVGPTGIRYRVDDERWLRRLPRVLPGGWRGEWDPPVPRERLYHDTFDWRLHRGDLRLIVEDAALRLESAAGQIRAALEVEPPGFATDLPPGSMRDAIEPLAGIRRLLPIARVGGERRTLRVLDGNGKIVLRVEIQRRIAGGPEGRPPARAISSLLRVVPVRGGRAPRRQLLALLDAAPGLERLGDDGFAEIAAAAGRRPGDYSSQLIIELDPAMRADAAMKAIHARLLDQIRWNEEGTRRDWDTEFLHDLRVAVRRTRSALAQVKGVFPPSVLERYRSRFRWLGGVTGPLRDLDVLDLEFPGYRAALAGDPGDDLEALAGLLAERRRAEQAGVASALVSAEYRRLVRGWSAYLARPVPRRPSAPNAARPVVEVAGERILAVFRRVVRRGRVVDDDSPDEAIHDLRIECKKLRYLLECFRSLYDEKASRGPLRALRKLQDTLGEFNDYAVHQALLAECAGELAARGRAGPGELVVIGRLMERLAIRQAKRRKACRRRFESFADAAHAERFRSFVRDAGADG